ncbi:hypothetical protein FSARC_14128 [Fusarium sarcochroum]|uniref:Uncharacterized protein n=1 Tax=Fusarium sarcochroum TaxID=1208366 RepID=A0A8H4SW66_9HYPO|nr:hypothetical protein FSARC_14128 [Fusarium sarcochroum]
MTGNNNAPTIALVSMTIQLGLISEELDDLVTPADNVTSSVYLIWSSMNRLGKIIGELVIATIYFDPPVSVFEALTSSLQVRDMCAQHFEEHGMQVNQLPR